MTPDQTTTADALRNEIENLLDEFEPIASTRLAADEIVNRIVWPALAARDAEIERLRGELQIMTTDRDYCEQDCEAAETQRRALWDLLKRSVRETVKAIDRWHESWGTAVRERNAARAQLDDLRTKAVVLPDDWSEQLAAHGQIIAIDMLAAWADRPAGESGGARWDPSQNCYCGGLEENYPRRRGTGRNCRAEAGRG